MRLWLPFLAVVLAASPGATEEPLDCYVSIPPLAYLVDRIGGSQVRTHVLAADGQDPHLMEPVPRHVMELGKADIFFTVGLPLETSVLDRLRPLPARLKLVDTLKGIGRRHATHAPHDHDACRHGPGAEDPHVWLSPRNMRQIARNVADGLLAIESVDAAPVRTNVLDLARELVALEDRIRNTLQPHEGKAIYVFHPAFGYFADAFGLVQRPVEVQARRPTPRQLAAITGEARARGVRVLFVQPQFDRKSAETVARAIGGTVESLDPLARDVPANLQHICDAIDRALRREAGP